MYYDFDIFISSVKYLDRQDIFEAANTEHLSLQKASPRYSKNERLMFQNSLLGLLYWVKTLRRPENMNEFDFSKLKPLCQTLIKKRQMASRTIKLFN